jgi:ribonuclease HI
MTNNEAEYAALCDGLEYLVGLIRSFGRDPAEFSLEVRGDSELILRQLSGRYRARDRRMAAARNRALALLQSFKSFVLTHQPREETVRQLGH